MSTLVTRRETSRRETDVRRMERHIEYLSMARAMYPKDKRDAQHFKPLEVPILDTLAMEADQEYGWQFPSKETLQYFQAYQGIGDLVLDDCIVKEIVLNGTQSEQEQLEIISWQRERMAEDNKIFPYSPLSLDVEQVLCTLKDVLRQPIPIHSISGC